jgi:alcohol dehydrogenase class IV
VQEFTSLARAGRFDGVRRADYHGPTRVVSGPGSRHEISALLAGLETHRPYVLCGAHLVRSGVFGELEGEIGPLLAGATCDVPSAASLEDIERLRADVGRSGADALVAIGGGSVLDIAKALAAVLAENKPLPEIAFRFTPPDHIAVVGVTKPALPIIAVPTTAGSASETNSMGGVFRETATGREKVGIGSPRLSPAVAVLDPELTLSLSPHLTVTTGANSVAHAIEAIYSSSASPIPTAFALEALAIMRDSLPRCVSHPDDISARGLQQMASAMSGFALGGAMVGLHHALCHGLTGACGVSHGDAHAIMLPHALRHNADAVGPELVRVGVAMRLGGGDAGSVVEDLAAWLADCGAPTRLRDVGIDHGALGLAAEIGWRNVCTAFNPKEIDGSPAFLGIYEQAW